MSRARILLLLVAALGLTFWTTRSAPPAAPATSTTAAQPLARVVVGLDGGQADALALAASLGGQVAVWSAPLRLAVIEAPASSAVALRDHVEGRAGVAFVELDRRAEPSGGLDCVCQGGGGPGHPARDVFGLGEIGAAISLPEAWAEAESLGQGVLVGVVDTGVREDVAALKGACAAGVDLTEGDDATDRHGHGTAMAGLIAGRGDGQSGFRGVAPRATVLPVKVADDRGTAPLERVARGIAVAADRGARVIYVGLGARGDSQALSRAVSYARAAGALVVCPAGNDGLDQLRTPAVEPAALAVGACGQRGLALLSNRSSALSLAAPGEHVPAPHVGGARYIDGTSPAAAIAAGVAALALGESGDLSPEALQRALVAGAKPVHTDAVLSERLPVRRLDAARAVRHARAGFTELAFASARFEPDPPVAGKACRVRAELVNRGRAALTTVSAALEGEEPVEVGALGPGERRTVELSYTPPAQPAPLVLTLNAQALPSEGSGPQAFAVARTQVATHSSQRPRPNFAVASVRLVRPMTLESPVATFAIRIENRGAATGKGWLHTAVSGERLDEVELRLTPGEVVEHELSWEGDGLPTRPVELEAFAACDSDPFVADDLDTMRIGLADPSLPLDPLYRQDAEVDLVVDAPWRLAADRSHLPVMVFAPSIGRRSSYATFQSLAMRRGQMIKPHLDSGRHPRARAAVKEAVGGVLTYTAAKFVQELGEAVQGDDESLRQFFNELLTTDFAIDYTLFTAGAWGGRMAFEKIIGKAEGLSLRQTLVRSQVTIAAGYLLPNLVYRGRLDRKVWIDLAALGISTASVEVLVHAAKAGIARAGLARTALGTRLTAFLARYGKVAKAGGWAMQVGQLALILYASEGMSDAVDGWLVRREARRALRAAAEGLDGLEALDEAAFEAALEEFQDAFDAYRNLMAHGMEGALADLNDELKATARRVYNREVALKQSGEAGSFSERLSKSIERMRNIYDKQTNEELRAAMAAFQGAYGESLRELYDGSASASLDEPGASKPALFDLEARLLERARDQLPAGPRRERLERELETLARLKVLDLSLVEVLSAGSQVGVPVRLEELIGTDGLLIHQAKLSVRDSWHEEVATDQPPAGSAALPEVERAVIEENQAKLEARPNKFAPLGSVQERVLYQHDVARERYGAAPGVERLDEDGAPREHLALFDAPRPIALKGRYEILRIPREHLEELAVGGVVFLKADLNYAISHVNRGVRQTGSEGTFSQVLRVSLAPAPGLPALPGLQGGYLDAHYHTIAEWYNPEPGTGADLELDAPRKAYGGPIPMLVESAWAVGAIEAPTLEAARDRLVTTDHNGFYVRGDQLAYRPPYGPTSARMSGGKTEFERMRELLGESVGEELTYKKEGLANVGVHMLDYRGRHFDGTWNAKFPLFGAARIVAASEQPTLERVLGTFAQGEGPDARAFSYASHPFDAGIPWEPDKIREALTDYARVGDKSFPFKGLQVWNTRAGRSHSMEKLHKWLDDLNPFVSRGWQRGQAFDADLQQGLFEYGRLLREMALIRNPLDPRVQQIRKLYLLAGSDAHGDFNYTTGGLATFIAVLANSVGAEDLSNRALELSDSAFMKARTFVATSGEDSLVEGMSRGASVITDGPLAWFELDGDGRFDAKTGVYDYRRAPRFGAGEVTGRIGGAGDFDGGRTVLVANDEAAPVFRYAYANSDDFGRPVRRDRLGRPLAWDGTIERLAVYKTDSDRAVGLGVARLEASGALETHGGRAFGRLFEEPLDVNEEGAVGQVSAIQLSAVTTSDASTSPADVYRCYTNPVWAARVGIVAHLDPAKFQGGVIQPGGLVVELSSPISLAEDALKLEVRALNAEGRAEGAALTALKAEGWEVPERAEAGHRGGLFRAVNAEPIALAQLAPFAISDRLQGGVTLVVTTVDAPRDHFGNQLNAVAGLFEVHPASGLPGKNADQRTDLTPVRFADPSGGPGFTGALPKVDGR